MEVVLYSSGCPKCQVLESKLMAKGIPFKITNNFQEIIDRGFQFAPVLKVGEVFMNFTEANKWVNER